MNRNSTRILCAVPTALLAVVCLIFLLDRKESQSQRQRLACELQRSTRAADERLEGAEAKIEALQGLLRSVKGELAVLADQVTKVKEAPAIQPVVEAGAEEAAAAEPAAAGGASEELERLPPLPEGFLASLFLKEPNLDEFFANPAHNPEDRALSQVERMKALSEVTAARAQIDGLEGKVQLAVAQGLESLRTQGSYVDLAPGESPDASLDLMSAAEPTENGGMRMYYFGQDEFPEIYRLRNEMKEVAEVSVRRLLSMVNG